MTTEKTQLEQQIEYANDLDAKGLDFGFAVGEAFIQSMRNTHYKHTGTALDELIDNSIEAGATHVSVALGYGGKSNAKPDSLAVIDNGHGMPKNMLRRAAAWGGTHRHGPEARTGLGRFGFGLPSASVNQARSFSIYSRLDDGGWYCVKIDLDNVAQYADETGKISVPEEEAKQPPKWVLEHIKKNMPGGSLEHGTVIVWEKMDRIKLTTTTAMRRNLLPHFGTVFRNYIQQTTIKFDGTTMEALDPLFITPDFRGYDLDEDRAQPMEAATIEIKNSQTGVRAKVKVRYALFPLTFFSVDKTKDAKGANQNERFKVSNDHRGIIICRKGRQIDVVDSTNWKGFEKFSNNDRYWGAEINFPPELDEEFTIANSKQGVVMSENIWDRLKDGGMFAALKNLKQAVGAAQKANRVQADTSEGPRASERSMEESEKYKRKPATANAKQKEEEAKKNFEQFVKSKARNEDRDEDKVREEAQRDAQAHPYKVEFADLPGAPFYRITQRGGMTVLELNRAHSFYAQVYASDSANRFVRGGLEVLLFSIGMAELDAIGNQDKSAFYTVEKQAWSERLEVALRSFSQFGVEIDEEDTAHQEVA